MNNLWRLTAILGICSLFYLPAAMAIETAKIITHGFVDVEFEKSNHDTLGDPNGSFDQVHFNLLTEYAASDTMSAKLNLEFEHSPITEDDTGSVAIEWSYLEYIVNNSIKIRAGKTLTPFGIYNEVHDATPTRPFIRIPWGIYASEKVGGFDMIPHHNTGLFLLGNHYLTGDVNLNYVLYVGNGENDVENSAEIDENKNKALGARVNISPTNDITLSGSYYKDKVGVAETEHKSANLIASYTPYPLLARAEYAVSKLGAVTEKSGYVEASYAINKFNPYFRYSMLDPDKDTSNDNWTELDIGVAYQLQPNVLLKLEDRSVRGKPGNIEINDDYNEIAAAVTVAF